jgi:ferredoxin-NADP reductase
VTELVQETPRTKSISLELPHALGHRAGQHVDVRLTAEDGYQAQRSYSIGSAPEDPALVLTVERLDDGEVSPYLTDELRPGDELELRGPIGGYFVWEEALGGPVELIAGGSGIVPLHAILRHWAAGSRSASIRLLYSARSLTDVIYRDELARVVATPNEAPLVYICGPTPFVEAVAEALVGIGHDPKRIRTERFGPTGS